jgi:O-acetylserine/cysteine efflux transporter
LAIDGPAALPQALLRSTWMDLGMVLYLGLASGTLGYAIWSSLLQKYSAAQVTPFALLVPFFAAASSWLLLGEQFGPIRVVGMGFVVAGLAIIVLPSRRG